MKKFVPYEKMSKKQKKALDSMKRKSWGCLDPRTRVPDDPKVYKRSKFRYSGISDEDKSDSSSDILLL